MSKRLRSSEMCADCSGPGESPRPGPLPSALLPGTPAPRRPRGSGGSRRPSPAPRGPGVATRSHWGSLGARAVPGLSEPGGQGAAALRSPPSLRPRPGGEGAGSRPGSFLHRKGLGQRAGRPVTEVSAGVLPAAARRRRCHLPRRPEPAAPPGPCPRGRPSPLPSAGTSPPTRGRLPAPDVRAPLPRGESPGCRGLAHAPRHLGVDACLRFWHLSGPSSH